MLVGFRVIVSLLLVFCLNEAPAIACRHYYGKAYHYWVSAKRLEDQGNYKQAVAVYQKALGAVPKIKYAHLRECAIYRTKARIEAAQEALNFLGEQKRNPNSLKKAQKICSEKFQEIINVQNRLRPDLAHTCPL